MYVSDLNKCSNNQRVLNFNVREGTREMSDVYRAAHVQNTNLLSAERRNLKQARQCYAIVRNMVNKMKIDLRSWTICILKKKKKRQ